MTTPAPPILAEPRYHRVERADAVLHLLDEQAPAGHRAPRHSHDRVQFLCVFAGLAAVTTDRGRWMVPPGHALRIPQRLEHEVDMLSEVDLTSLYLPPRPDDEGEDGPTVRAISPLARSLIGEAIRLGDAPEGDRRAALVYALLAEEAAALPVRPLGLPFPSDPRLAALCRAFMRDPTAEARIDDWAAELAMSRRTFTRFFARQTGAGFATWRQQASIFASLPHLAAGEPVSRVAMRAGYGNVSAFTTMFRRMLGAAPRDYVRAARGDASA